MHIDLILTKIHVVGNYCYPHFLTEETVVIAVGPGMHK